MNLLPALLDPIRLPAWELKAKLVGFDVKGIPANHSSKQKATHGCLEPALLLLLLLMIKFLHYLKDPKLWELWYIFLIMGNAGF